MPSTDKQYFGALESLRGLAALAVALYHVNWVTPLTGLSFVHNSPLMVDFFFVLSGFVICHSYGDRIRDRASTLRFVCLRLGRLYPLHLAMLLVFTCFELAKLYAQHRLGLTPAKPAFTVSSPASFVRHLLLIQGLDTETGDTFNYPSWSISTEFYTYLLFATVVLMTGRSAALTVASIIAVAMGLLALQAVHASTIDVTTDFGFYRCCAGFFLGVLTHQLYRRLVGRSEDDARWNWAGYAAVLTAVAYLCWKPAERFGYEFLALSAATILTVALSPASALATLLNRAFMRWLGAISYSIYMVHAAIDWVLVQVMTVVLKQHTAFVPSHDGWVTTPTPLIGDSFLLLYVALVLGIATLTYRWIEQPARRKAKQLARTTAESTELAPPLVASLP